MGPCSRYIWFMEILSTSEYGRSDILDAEEKCGFAFII